MSKLYTKTITTPTGKRKYIRAATKEELERKYQQAKLEIGAGVDITDATTFGEFAQLWFNTYKRPNLRENSKENLLYSTTTSCLSSLLCVCATLSLCISAASCRA